ncbi:NAD-dependent epimerase/dehydratase family protein [Hyphobacterium sp. CCMP332]|uniref:NAD-dependent epimerase/dehydratase family protein n=1 Tax=Hyphobacterium sp. CCMP332 TaxID=2749086 RepID=UPI00164FA7E7|nr:NAD-dependent epimerase/dehydratase family protein [Hyphobacterium sp. CCMP332]QNL17892.1 NAD-dependent epimerase/dehydratase family protein [Hyphobacterium sp. CCMP332]
MKILVTGAAGFIGSHTSHALLTSGHEVLGIDNLNDYYDPALKRARLANLSCLSGFDFEKLDIAEDVALGALTAKYQPDRIIHLAAQAGVRYSLENPMAYARSNLLGHLAVLEAVRHTPSVKHLVYASSSSVYGERNDTPFSENDPVENPVSLYAATKRADELMSVAYSRLYGLTQTGLRFFTVYGSWGRPDMAYWRFTDAILKGEPIRVFNKGEMQRDFTYIDDVVRTAVKITEDTPNAARHRIYNIGGSDPRPLKDFIAAIEAALGMEAKKIYLPMQKGDVTKTSADVSAITRDYSYAATTSIEDGIRIFVDWYRDFYSV